jgi:serine/threonine protein phosphatase PrpC
MNKSFIFLTLIISATTQASSDPAANAKIGTAWSQGKRDYMEDRHMVYHDPKGLFLAVYDGHGGSLVAEYAKLHLHKRLFAHPDIDKDPQKAMSETLWP